MVRRWRIFAFCIFSEPRAAHTAENRRGKKKKEEETTAAKYNGLPYWAATISVISMLKAPLVKTR